MANYNTSANVVLTVNGKQAQSMLAQLEKDAKKLEKGIADASLAGDKVTMKKLQSELRATNRMMEQLKGGANSAEQVLQKLDSATPRELQKGLFALQNQLKSIAHNSDEFDKVQGKIRLIQSEMQKLSQQNGLVAETFENLDKASPNQLRLSLKTLNAQLDNLERGSAAWKTQTELIAIFDAELQKANIRTESMTQTLRHLNSASPAELNDALKVLNAQLQHTKQGSASFDLIKERILAVEQRIREVNIDTVTLEKTFLDLDKASPRMLTASINALKSQLQDLPAGSAAWDAHRQKISLLDGKLRELNLDMNQVYKTLYDFRNATPRELETALATLKSQLKDIAVGSAAWDDNRAKIKLLEEELRRISLDTEVVRETFADLNKATPQMLQQSLATLKSQLLSLEPSSKAWDEHKQKILIVEQRIKDLNLDTVTLRNTLASINTATPKMLEVSLKTLEAQLRNTPHGTDNWVIISEKIKLVRHQIEITKQDTATLNATLSNLNKATPTQLQTSLKILKAQLEDIKRGTAAWDAHVEKIKSVKKEIESINQSLETEKSLWQRMNDWLNQCQTAILGIGAAVSGIILAARKAVNAFADMDQEMANVRKFTGMSADEVATLNEAFKRIDTRSSREELNQLAQEAGRLGKTSQEDVLGFVRAADKINVALDDLGSGATLTLSKLTGIFGDEKRLGTERSLLAVGSVINELSQNCSASAPYIAEFASRMGGVGAQANLTVQQIMAFAAVLDSNNQKLEASSTALSQVIVRIYQDPAKYAKVAGMDVQRFAALVKTDMNAAILEFLSTLKRAGNMKVLAPMFKDMDENGSRAISALSTLANHIEDVKAQQDAANVAFAEATSINNEFDVQNTTVQAGLEKAKKNVNEIAVALGEKLAPVMKHIVSTSGIFLRVLSTIIDFIYNFRIEIASAGVAMATYFLLTTKMTAATKLAAAAHAAWSFIVKNLSSVFALFKVGAAAALNAVQYFTNGLQVNYQMQLRWQSAIKAVSMTSWVGLILAAGAALYSLYRRHLDNIKAMQKQREEQQKLTQHYREGVDWSGRAVEAYSKEINSLKFLYDAATNEANAKEKRIGAAKKLLQLYPETFARYSTEQIMLGQTKQAYDQLAESIIKAAEARAAAELYQENAKKILQLKVERVPLRINRENAISDRDKGRAYNQSQNDKLRNQSTTVTGAMALQGGSLGTVHEQIDLTELDKKVYETTSALNKNIEESNTYIQMNNYILGQFKNNSIFRAEMSSTDSSNKQLANPKLDFTPAKGSFSSGAAAASSNSYETPGEKEGYVSEKVRAKQQREADAAHKKKIANQKKKEREAAAAQRKAKALEKKTLKEQIDSVEADWKTADALNNDKRSKGLIPWKEYLENKYQLELDFYDDCLELYDNAGKKESNEYAETLNDKSKLLEEWYQKMEKLEIDELKDKESMEVIKANVDYYNQKSKTYQNETALQQQLFEIKIKYLEAYRDVYVETSEEYADYSKQIQKAEADEMLRLQQEYAQKISEWKQKYQYEDASKRMKLETDLLDVIYKQNLISEDDYNRAKKDIQKKYADEYLPDNAKKSDDNASNLEKRKKRELEIIESLEAQGVLTHEQAEKAKDNINNAYRKKHLDAVKQFGSAEANQLLDIYEAWQNFFNATEKDGGNWATRLASLASSVFAVMTAGMQQASEFLQASADIETAKIEKKYDREIELAEGNSYRVKKAERDKEKEISKIKSDAARKQFAMQVIQAVAQTATNALNAYGSAAAVPVIGYILAPIAASMAVAAGMMQVATLKKQQQASEAQGYMTGGFTPDGRADEVAGVVHKGEWVASQALVNNPQTRPLLEALDYAQRTNTIGSIKMADVSKTITAPAVLAAQQSAPTIVNNTTVVPQSSEMQATLSTLDSTLSSLHDRLDEPMGAIVTVAGDYGIERAKSEYEQLLRNKSHKSRK